MRIWICAVAKMEELYIREWIEWHKNIGIDHIVLGDNNDSDYDHPLQPIIQDYIDEGYVEYVNKNDVLNVQQPFYNEIYLNRKNEFDWMGFIDIDEFVELPAYNNDIHKFISDDIFINADAIIFQWLMYTDNEQVYYENKPVKERFTTSIKKKKKWLGIKYFIKSILDIKHINSIHCPEDIKPKTISINIVDVLGNKDFNKDIRPYGNYVRIERNAEYFNNAYISHYIYRSTEEFIKYKMLRGRCDRKIGKYDIRYTMNMYFQSNTKTDEKIKLFYQYKDLTDNFSKNIIQKYNSN